MKNTLVFFGIGDFHSLDDYLKNDKKVIRQSKQTIPR